MIAVQISKPWRNPNILRQTPGASGTWGDIRFSLDHETKADYLIVLNHLHEDLVTSTPIENRWCFIQEPPLDDFRCFEAGFSAFSKIHTQDPRLRGQKFIQTHGCLPWHVGKTYDELKADKSPAKTKSLSWITSNLATHKGHLKRLNFLRRLQESNTTFDLYGRGFNPLPDKWNGLVDYEYALAVENHSAKHYWTEKISDCFLAGCMPIYYGAPNIGDYFPEDSYIWLDITDRHAPLKLQELIASNKARKCRDAIMEAKRRVLEEYNLFPCIEKLIKKQALPSAAPLASPVILKGIVDTSVGYGKRNLFGRIMRKIEGLLQRVT